MKHVRFTPEEKISLFDTISAQYYDRNFGQCSKADMELLMFRFYIEKLIKSNCAEDGTIDYSKCSDYLISKELGISQQRVRNLKVKNQLINPIEYDWKAALAKLTRHARFDPVTHRVTLHIPDPNLFLEIQNFFEEQGSCIERQLNSKVLQIRAEYYIDLILSLEPEKARKAVITELKKAFKETSKEQSVFDEKNIGRTLVEGAVNLTTIAANISDILSPDNYIGNALIDLLRSAMTP